MTNYNTEVLLNKKLLIASLKIVDFQLDNGQNQSINNDMNSQFRRKFQMFMLNVKILHLEFKLKFSFSKFIMSKLNVM